MPICTPLGSAFPLVLHPPVEQVLHTHNVMHTCTHHSTHTATHCDMYTHARARNPEPQAGPRARPLCASRCMECHGWVHTQACMRPRRAARCVGPRFRRRGCARVQWCMPALFRMHAPRIYRPSRPFLICRPTLTKALCKPYFDMPLSCRPSQPFLMCRPTQMKALRTPYSDMPLCTVAVLPTHGGSLPTRDGSMNSANSVVLHLFGGRPGDSVDLHLLDIWPRKGATFESTGLHSLRYSYLEQQLSLLRLLF